MTDNETTENTDAVTEIETTETPAASTEGTDAAEGEKPFVFVEDPAFEIEYKGECAYEVKVTIPTANESKKADELYEELKHDVEVPGFRKGRAPRRLIERKFSKHVKNEVQEKLITAAFEKLVKDNKLRPLSGLEIDGLEEAKERAEGEPLAFTLKFEVAPRCELGQYRGVEAERPVLEVSEADIAEAIDQVRGRYSVYEPIEEGAAENGDQVLISFVGTIDGEEFAGGKADNYPYILGSQRFFKEFEEVLTGSSIGQELSTEVTFPDTYSNADLRGKAAQFKIAVKEIKRRQSPELDDKFAEQAGYKNVEDLREKVTAQLREGAAAQSDRVAQSRVLDAVIQGSTFEFPKSLLKKLSDEVYEEEL
ncbi:MAG: Trigger factor, partial [Candidatus Hydrogenedentes bacterium]|nr:Trigger factor [Candidatus Hydrogenedentota bacterium]